ncbi:MAG: alpha/beta fold hydrolase [Intrasporangium sp.]|uniref:alpha/beta fold hydrolase n=1 Tax=Intrasporangium sp. TaxID=1925024 RepID=UPI003F7CFF22
MTTPPITRDLTIAGADGRSTSIRLTGAERGRPLLWLHGFGGSRLEQHPDAALAAAAGVLVVAPDRPGIGTSSPAGTRTLLDTAAETAAVMHHLGHDRYAVAGLSWGAAHAAAVARADAGSVTRLGLVSPVTGWLRGPGRLPDRPGPWAAIGWLAGHPVLLRAALALQTRSFRRDPQATVSKLAASAPAADATVLADDGVRAMLVAKTQAALEQGIAGLAADTRAVAQPWGFALSDLTTSTIVWWGEQDSEIPHSWVEALPETVSDCELRVVPDAGHLLYLSVWSEILALATTEPDLGMTEPEGSGTKSDRAAG